MWPTFYIPSRIKPRVVSRFYLTTPPYPIETRDTIKSATALVGGSQSTYDQDSNIKSSTAFISGELVVRLKSQVQPPDDIKSDTALVSGDLIVRLKSQVQPPDDIKSATAFISGNLARVLISYEHWPLTVADESLKSNTSFVSGTLT